MLSFLISKTTDYEGCRLDSMDLEQPRIVRGNLIIKFEFPIQIIIEGLQNMTKMFDRREKNRSNGENYAEKPDPE